MTDHTPINIGHQDTPRSHATSGDIFLYTGAMFRYCFKMGMALPDSLYQDYLDICHGPGSPGETVSSPGKTTQKDMEALTLIFNTLSAKVAPAIPDAIYLIEKGMQPVHIGRHLLGFRFLGPVSIVRGLMGAALIALVVFLSLSLSTYVNADNMTKTLLELSGCELACNLLFLISAAALGASFSALFELKTYIVHRTYDSVYETDYWIRFFLGIISGILLAELIPINLWLGSASAGGVTDPASPQSVPLLTRPVLAMLGGFSVKAFYQVLKRIVHTLETLIQGKPLGKSSDPRVEMNHQLNAQNLKYKAQMLSDVGKLHQLISKGEPLDVIKKEIDSVLESVRHSS